MTQNSKNTAKLSGTAKINVIGKATIRAKIKEMPDGTVFSPSTFLAEADRGIVGMALKRLADDGFIRKIGRGLYDKPKYSNVLEKNLPPSSEAVRAALEEKTGLRFKHTGPLASNMLGLSTQVPARITFLTDGESKKFNILGQEVEVKHAGTKRMASTGICGMLIEALYDMGKNFDEKKIEPLKQIFREEDKKELLKQLKYAPIWMHKYLRKVAEP